MKCSLYLIFKYSMLIVMLSFNLALLAIKDYFSNKSSGSAHFGLSSVFYSSKTYSYLKFSKICTKTISSHRICENLNNLNQAGEIFKICIAFDIIILVIYSIISILEQFILRKTIKSIITGIEPSKMLKFSLVFCNRLRLIFLLHPVLINVGVGIWIKISNIDKFSNEMKIEGGLIVMIFQCFFSLLITASFFWEMSAMKRRNLRQMKGQGRKFESEARECLEQADVVNKTPSFDQSFDQSFEEKQ
ncbi:hypothetical protein SteCoe_27813 [Stentor coeruleus]|uniref:Uncharacterized protein n=1 Tax=Stentor coeruleus TaxID=5963 RepID=A0A1R2BA56_9CILI|nr:hypothetical protein SteCoe_27813 [Stentor coeruleus]